MRDAAYFLLIGNMFLRCQTVTQQRIRKNTTKNCTTVT